MLVLFSCALVLNVSDVSAATSNNISVNHTGATSVGSKVTFTPSQVNAAAAKVKAYHESNGKLPSYVTVNNQQVTMPQFLQLLSYDIAQTNSGSAASITLKNVNEPSNPTETIVGGTLTKSQYVSLANLVKSSIDSTGTAPNNMNSPLGKIRFENLVYIFSKTAVFYNTNHRLPNTLSITPWISAEGAASSDVQSILDSIGYAEAKFRDVQGQSSASVMDKVGYGDCWASSHWLYNKLSAAGIPVRIMETSSGGILYLHQWAAINVGNGWQTWNYAKYHSQHYGALGSGAFVVKQFL